MKIREVSITYAADIKQHPCNVRAVRKEREVKSRKLQLCCTCTRSGAKRSNEHEKIFGSQCMQLQYM